MLYVNNSLSKKLSEVPFFSFLRQYFQLFPFKGSQFLFANMDTRCSSSVPKDDWLLGPRRSRRTVLDARCQSRDRITKFESEVFKLSRVKSEGRLERESDSERTERLDIDGQRAMDKLSAALSLTTLGGSRCALSDDFSPCLDDGLPN